MSKKSSTFVPLNDMTMKKTAFFVLALLGLTACQPEVQQAAKVYGRYVPERKDDFAWENEYAAFRMYGPALRPENPSNGVDLWLKKSPELVVDSFYYRELVCGLSYHVNYGKGLDCYKVSHTAGCGGLVVIAHDPASLEKEDGSDMDMLLCVGNAYDRWEILEQTPDKFVFRLEYDSFEVAGHVLKESITITAEAGQILNRADVVLSGDYEDELWVGGGIYLHDTIDNVYTCDHCGVIAYAENAVSDKTAAKLNRLLMTVKPNLPNLKVLTNPKITMMI